jgi:hypothetical protein
MSEFVVKEQTYRAGALSARDQFHIVRRLAPFLSSLAPALGNIDIKGFREAKAAGEDPKEAIKMDDLAKILPALGNALASMSDEQADYVIFGLLKVVVRKEANGLGWPSITNGNVLQYADIDMMSMLAIAAQVLMANAGGFFDALNSVFSQPDQKPSVQ